MEGKVAIVTGARRGLGAEIARKLAGGGCIVVVNDKLEPEKIEAFAAGLKDEFHVETASFFGDVSQEETVREFVDFVTGKFGKVDILVNNAADVVDMPMAERTTELFKDTLNNNVMSTYLMSEHFGQKMFEAKSGKIINISSTNGINAFFPTSIDYDASKAAVINLTHNFAIEYAPYVLVNSVAPGWMKTEMNDQLSDEEIAAETEKIYLKRFAEPAEIAKFVAWLASDENTYMTGEVVKVDGGY